ncbi:CBO0543 family protein [Pseudalkalibacillus sp. R45]|uniref:CBO0543 family protein n=1 Tax=Pseudalkalibacillus sp. R45 TaxID=3457433 RepID=UPI003FCD66F4
MLIFILYFIIYIVAAWKWGDWKNWRVYYPTILFFIVGDLLYQFLFHDYSKWEYESFHMENAMDFTHTHISLFVMVIKYPATILIYLGNFPEKKINIFFYILLWVLIYCINEMITLWVDGISFHNSWHYGWSILFNFIMFIILYIHHRNPLTAWGISILFIIILWNLHEVPTDILK